MSASATDPSSSSISSTGHFDGLGRRSLSFDRETGEMLERLHVQPELVAFEPLIRDRVARLAAFDDDRFARPARVERDADTGELTVLAEFITGSRISDLLEATADAAIVPGVDVALGYLLESLPALTLLHTSAGVVHGLIDASRTVLTPDGQVVFLDAALGSAVESLTLSRQRLWTGFGVASPPGSGAVHFDAASDVAQVALGAVALVLGRNLRADEYPDALPSLLMEVIEVAQIRGTSGFAAGLQRFLQRSLPLPGRRPYATAEEAAADVRQLVRRDIGVDVCRAAVVDFAAQMDATFFGAPDDDDPAALDRDDYSAPVSAVVRRPLPELDEFLESFEHPPADEPHADVHAARTDPPADEPIEDGADETEISLDNLDADTQVAPERDSELIYDLPPLDEVMAEANLLSRPSPPPLPAYRYSEPDPAPAEPLTQSVGDSFAADATVDAPVEDIEEAWTPPAFDAPEPAHEPVAAPTDLATPTLEAAEPAPHLVVEPPAMAPPTAAGEPEPEPDKDSAPSRRRKRQQQKSARARKDKLRSSTAGTKMPLPPVPQPEPARPASPTGWLVSPQRAASFEPPVSVPQPAPPPMRVAPVPAMPSFVPTPVGSMPQPIYPASGAVPYGTPSSQPPARPGPLEPPLVPQATQPTVQVKLRTEPPAGFTPRRSAHAEPPPVAMPPARYGTLGLGRSDSTYGEEEPRRFPAKLAAVAVGVAVIAVFVGRLYLPGRTAVTGEPGAPLESPTTMSSRPQPAPAAPSSATSDTPIAAGRGRLVVQTQPPGIRVLVDRKAVGETPLRIDLPPGRRILTLQTSGGEVVRSVRIVAGKTETLDIPVFSGWVAIFAPIVLQVSADGRSLGTSEDTRLMLAPGKHLLTMTNREFDYRATQEVEIVPGEVKTINLEPRGTVSLNAIPWAEVWLDGQKLGDTPLASTPVPLGTQEFVFKNPQLGERKVSAIVKAGATALVTVDFSK